MRLTRHITGSEDPRIARSPVPVHDDPVGTAQPSPAREAGLRLHPDANHHSLRGHPPTVRQDNLLDVAATDKRLDLDAEMHLDTVVAMQVQSGITPPLNYYRSLELDWELLGGYEGRPLEVPALLIGGDRDIATMWAQTANREFGAHAPKARPTVVLENCGHWIQQEHPEKVNSLLLEFLSGL